MTKQEFEQIKVIGLRTTIHSHELTNQENRCLITGYDLNHKDYSVWLQDGKFVVYQDDRILVESRTLDVLFAQPSKHAYASRSDFEYIRLLRRAGCYVSLLDDFE